MEGPHNTLPNAEQIRLAIAEWWKGGGTTNLIVNVCRREMATLTESAALAQRLSSRVALGNDYVTDAVISEQLEYVRAVGAVLHSKEEEQAKSPNPTIGGIEWHRRATERAKRNADFSDPWKTWKWEKPAKQKGRL